MANYKSSAGEGKAPKEGMSYTSHRNKQNKDCREGAAGEAYPEAQPSAEGMLKKGMKHPDVPGGPGPQSDMVVHPHSDVASKKDKYAPM